MSPLLSLERLPIESREPIVAFAVIRGLVVISALIALSILGFPYGGGAAIVLAALALPWSVAVLFLTRRSPDAGLSPIVFAGDLAILGIVLAVEPETYGPVHFMALFLVAAHAHFQGEHRGLLVGALAAGVLIPISLSVDVPVANRMLHPYEVFFAVASLSTALVVGALRTAESSGRLRARALSRRTIDTESAVRRSLAESIHDGPIQELTSVDLMLASAEQAFNHGDEAAARHALTEARTLTRDNIVFLRDEIVQLGPHAFEERSLDQAIADCVDPWQRRYGFDVSVDMPPESLPPHVAGGLFRITQEAVANAGKHAEASKVHVGLSRTAGDVVLEITDDGRGFGAVDPLGPVEPGHIGLASMRERAEMLGGQLAIESGDDGTSVRVSVPL